MPYEKHGKVCIEIISIHKLLSLIFRSMKSGNEIKESGPS